METLIIDRTKWLRGETGSRLLRESDGKMCCLGFDALRRGYQISDIAGVFSPEQLKAPDKFTELIIEKGGQQLNSTQCYTLMMTNDAQSITDSERERQLTEKFAEIGIAVEFVN